jgi:5'-methylthioadenosine phosphorylase
MRMTERSTPEYTIVAKHGWSLSSNVEHVVDALPRGTTRLSKLAVIGGSGLYAFSLLPDSESISIETPFGRPSGPILKGRIGATDMLFLARHGPGHIYSPTDVPYRANIYALKALGASHLLSFSAVGSLREDLPPRTVALPDQIIDRTVSRPRTFFDDGPVVHVGLADPFCSEFSATISAAAFAIGRDVRLGGTYVCIEGPQFSTRAESNLYRSWDATIIGMTAMPEARLAREAGLCYAVMALVTDYDVWHESEADVSVETVMFNLRANADFAVNLVNQLCQQGLAERTCTCSGALDNAIVTSPRLVDARTRERFDLLLGDRWSFE